MLQRLKHAIGWGVPVPPTGCRVDFQVCAPLAHGQTLYLVGDIPSLGGSIDTIPVVSATANTSNTVESALALVTTPDLYPIWYNLQPIIVPSGIVIRYRYAICTGSKFTRFEMIGGDVTLQNDESGIPQLDETPEQPLIRELEVGLHDLQVLDTLDKLNVPSDTDTQDGKSNEYVENMESNDMLWSVVPRLSSGQAFVDRRATHSGDGGLQSEGGTSSGISSVHINSTLGTASNTLSGTRRQLTNSGISSTGGFNRRLASTMTLSLSIPEEEPTDEASMTDAELPEPPSIGVVTTDTLVASPKQNRLRSFSGSGIRSPSQSAKDIPARVRSVSGDADSVAKSNVTIESTDGVIIVSYRLPVLVKKVGDRSYDIEWEDDNLVCPSGFLKESSMSPNRRYRGKAIPPLHSSTMYQSHWDRISQMRITWVGTVHCSSPIPKEDEELLAKQLGKFHCVPVFLNPTLGAAFHGFCYGTLWPIFHNIVDVYGKLPTRWWNPSQEKNAWTSYKNVNRIFVNKVIEVYNDGDLVWVHDLHLLVAPSFLSRRLPNANVGIFLHTPFPSSEIFRTLSVRADLLRGMLSADHIGYHLYEHARHFLTSCRRILGLKYSAQPGGYIGIDYNGRMVMLTVSHIGIEPPYMDLIHSLKDVKTQYSTLCEEYLGSTGKGEWTKMQTIVSVDNIERLKGVLLKLGAIEYFLTQNVEWQSKLQVIQIGIIDSGYLTEKKQACFNEIIESVTRINAKFQHARDPNSKPVIVFETTESTNLEHRLPLWKLGDIFLSTSLRDAVNLYPFEFVYAQHISGSTGVLILSEFSGSSRVLTGSIAVNPWKQEEIIRALNSALNMTEHEKRARHKKDLEYITQNTRTKWAERILVDFKRTTKYSSDGDSMGYGLGLGYRMLEFQAGFKLLDIEQVARAYRTSIRRVLLFDYGNTLTLEERGGANDFSKYLATLADAKNANSNSTNISMDAHAPIQSASPQLLAALSNLCADQRNTVFVLSGKERKELETTLGSVRGLGLAAEHGYLYKWGEGNRNVEGNDDVWLCTKDNFDESWKDVTHSIMDIYTQRTHGTYIELKGSGLLWQYRDADPEFGQLQAKELQDQLTQVLEHFHVQVLQGSDYLEVRPEGVDKGVIVDRIMSTIDSTGNRFGGINEVDFILCVGDDLSDEFMFTYLEDNCPRDKLFTVTVGKKPSAAKYFVNDVDQVLELVHSLTKLSTTSNRNLSLNDLRLLDHRRPIRWDSNSLRQAELQPLASQTELPQDREEESEQLDNSSLQTFDRLSSSTLPQERQRCAVSGLSGLDLGSSSTLSRGQGMTRSSTGFRHSMSMGSLSSVSNSFEPRSSTFKQYWETIEEDQGGIFF